jgi:hypothetical protein
MARLHLAVHHHLAHQANGCPRWGWPPGINCSFKRPRPCRAVRARDTILDPLESIRLPSLAGERLRLVAVLGLLFHRVAILAETRPPSWSASSPPPPPSSSPCERRLLHRARAGLAKTLMHPVLKRSIMCIDTAVRVRHSSVSPVWPSAQSPVLAPSPSTWPPCSKSISPSCHGPFLLTAAGKHMALRELLPDAMLMPTIISRHTIRLAYLQIQRTDVLAFSRYHMLGCLSGQSSGLSKFLDMEFQLFPSPSLPGSPSRLSPRYHFPLLDDPPLLLFSPSRTHVIIYDSAALSDATCAAPAFDIRH